MLKNIYFLVKENQVKQPWNIAGVLYLKFAKPQVNPCFLWRMCYNIGVPDKQRGGEI